MREYDGGCGAEGPEAPWKGSPGMSALSASPEEVSPAGTGPEALSGARAAGRDPSDDSAGAKPDVRPGGSMVGASSDGAIVPDGLVSRTGAGERASGRGEGPVDKAGASRTGEEESTLGEPSTETSRVERVEGPGKGKTMQARTMTRTPQTRTPPKTNRTPQGSYLATLTWT